MTLVSFVIPTLNSATVLTDCLRSITIQKLKDYQIIIVDGGSTDKTITIARKFDALILSNPLKTAESAKAIGIKKAVGKYIALVDSDNILPHANWLEIMLNPLEKDPTIIGSEPDSFTYRPLAGYIERYCALIGANDPYAFICNIQDRFSYLIGDWNSLNLPTKNQPLYQKVTLQPGHLLPTIGANGTVFRRQFLKQYCRGNYLFDIDIITRVLEITKQPIYFSKVKIGIIHSFCQSSLTKYIRKQRRRAVDYYNYLPLRKYRWTAINQTGIIKYSLYTLPLIPAIVDSLRGYIKKPDIAWFFHPLACYLSFLIYAITTIEYRLGLVKPLNRHAWSQ